MIYVHQIGTLNCNENEEFDVKAAWKAVLPKSIRRTDRYIQLSLLGAYRAVEGVKLPQDTALYMASGQGNLAVVKRLRDQLYINQQPPKPVDFINSLSNTAGFYVAQFLNIEGKNLNVSRLGFVVETTLLLAQNDLSLKKEKMILLGGVDERQKSRSFTQRTLGISDTTALGEGSNWMLLSAEEEGSLASIEVGKVFLNLENLKEYIDSLDETTKIAFGLRCEKADIDVLLQGRKRFSVSCDFYESAAIYYLTTFIVSGSGELVFIDRYKERYRVIKVKLPTA